MRKRMVLWLPLLVACTSTRTIGQPSLSVHNDTINLVRRDKVDILFLIDNSPSMAAKQAELIARFPALVDRIQMLATSGAPASFHIGVVDSDLGAGPYNLNNGQCHQGGNGGKLHTAADPTARNAPADCANLKLTNGETFIDYDSATGVSNVEGVDLSGAFSCLASVGEAGCGFEAQLEAVYQALTPGTNPGFLRDDALLIVAFLTDEDDCSAPPNSDLFDPSSAGVTQYGILHSFRCTQFGILCDGKPLTGGAITSNNCAPVTGGPLFDVARYTNLFNANRANGGLKDSSSDVLLIALAAPPTPVDVGITQPCADQVNSPSCAILGHSCASPDNGALFGDPAVRIHAVMGSTANALEASICDDDYSTAIDSFANAMSARMLAGCLPGAVVDLAEPGCTVSVDGIDTPRCANDQRLPCWELNDDSGCPGRMTPAGNLQQLRFAVEGAKPNAAISATCPLYEPTP